MKFFICKNCHKKVSLKTFGTKYRNHCPYCLWSCHMDIKIGDRKSACQGLMKPLGLTTKKDGELKIIHKCTICDKVFTNRIAGDDKNQAIINLLKESKKHQKEIESKTKIPLFLDEKEVRTQLFGKF